MAELRTARATMLPSGGTDGEPLPDPPEVSVTIDASAPAANAQLEAGKPVTISGRTSTYRASVTGVSLEIQSPATGQTIPLGSATPVSGTDWSSWRATPTIPDSAYGTCQIVATVSGTLDLAESDSRSVQVLDHILPTLTISNTGNLAAIAVSASQKAASAVVTGTAVDRGSGISRVECSLDGGGYAAASLSPASGRSVNFSGPALSIPLDPAQRRAHTITVRCTDVSGNVTSQAVSVAATDVTAPNLAITSYLDSTGKALTPDTNNLYNVPGDENGGTLTLRGTASDNESSILAVDWSLDGAPFNQATLVSAGWASWSAAIVIPPFGKHMITVRSRDTYGNAQTRTLSAQVVVTVPWQKLDIADPASPWAYLVDLVNFGHNQITGLTGAYLNQWFYQAFDDARLKGYDPVHQIRIAVEVLRKYMTYLTGVAANGLPWVEDAVPNGATSSTDGGDPWTWVTANPTPISGRQAHQTAVVAGVHQHYFYNAPQPLPVGTGDILFAWVYLDPTSSPTEVMLQWNDGSSWEHRAFWGADQIAWGVAGQVSRRAMGALPATGRWVRLEVPASQVGLEGRRVNGMAFSLFGGKATWDVAGKIPGTRGILGQIQAAQAAAEALYRQAAYESLLTNLGTSFIELRLARQADPAVRQALGDRLGIDLLPAGTTAGTRPDRLDPGNLLLLGAQLTESALERLFGLVDTTRDPLAPAATPQFLQWQRDHLRTRWLLEDHPAAPMPAPRPVIVDPDMLQATDFQTSGSFNLTRDLWNRRSAWIATQLQQLANDRAAGETDQLRLDRLIDKNLGAGTVAQLQAVDAKRDAGQDISGDLATVGIDPGAFDYLIRLRQLATAPLLDSEWADFYSILVQVMKTRQFPVWQQEEGSLALSPDYFAITDPDATSGGDEPDLPRWRASRTARHVWLETLQSRIDQAGSLERALRAAVADAEEDTLPLLRDALVAAITRLVVPGSPAMPQVQDLNSVANQLSQRLLIDVNDTGKRLTTRVDQATETVQSLLFAVRTSRFPNQVTDQLGAGVNPTAVPGQVALMLRLDTSGDPATSARNFDEEWRWVGTYAAWRAAMRVFIYPEGLLLPSLWARATKSFGALIQATRDSGQSLTAAQAQDLARAYVQGSQAAPGVLAEISQDAAVGDVNAQNALKADLNSLRLASAEGQTDVALLDRARTALQVYNKYAGNNAALRYVQEYLYFVPVQLALQLQQTGQYVAALDWFRTVYAPELPRDQRKIYPLLKLEEGVSSATDYARTEQWPLSSLDPHNIALGRKNVYTRATLLMLAGCVLDYADAEFTADTAGSVSRARDLYLTALDLLDPSAPEWKPPVVGTDPSQVLAPSPALQSLLQQASLNLRKLRDSRNIAGLQRQLDLSGASEAAGAAGASDAPTSTTYTPTPYRYAVLVERAKQLVALAQQMEQQYLSSIEKQEAEAYSLFKATQDLETASAGIQLQELEWNEANDSVTLAGLQQQKAQQAVDHYDDLMSSGLSGLEMASLAMSGTAAGLQLAAAATSFFAATLPASISASVNIGFPSFGTSLSVSESPQGSALAVAGGLSNLAAAASTGASITGTLASYERRQQEWAYQAAQSRQDVAIGAQQQTLARDHRDIVEQQWQIAQLQDDHARATVNFLANKFLNAELYQWMSGVLGRVYAYFLQQSTAVARLAQDQLAFERQEQPLSFIQTDYWQVTPQSGAPIVANNPDRRGLTGSARLLEDIVRLDQYAFETNRRKLQLSKTISLAQLAPFEFQQFRETGLLHFATPMELFDRDFPGHYLRLVKRVRTSVIALIPPSQGIRAMLTSSGLSRVTVGGQDFRTVVARRDPESVALTSAVNATGVFELDTQSDMLLPFESSGVDTSWVLEMPKAANPFDFRTIGDVLFTIEYTALHSPEYRRQVVRTLDRSFSADRVYSLRQEFPDQWYDLNNAPPTAPAMTIDFRTPREGYPPNLYQLAIQQVLLYYALNGQPQVALPTSTLQFSVDGQTFGGPANPVDGVISTRRSNGVSWLGMLNREPVGSWTLSLPNDGTTRALFDGEQIDDILLVVTYSSQTPEWPA